MSFNPVPTELTTAATDVLLGLLAIACVGYLRRFSDRDPWRVAIWSWVFGLLGFASVLGAVAHGIQLAPSARDALWQPLYLCLGLVVALFVVAAAYDWKGRHFARRMVPIMIVIAIGFFGATRLFVGSFLVFVVYEAAAMIAALTVYSVLAVRRRLPGSGVIAVAIALNILAAAIQASGSISLEIIWPLDHNGVFHLVQIVAVVVMVSGLRAGFLAHQLPVAR
jgi:hypothetical protein